MTGPAERLETGGCECGAVRFETRGETDWSAGCCCRDCARASGTPYSVWVSFAPDRVRFTRGAPAIRESSEGVLRGFCGSCGSTLTYGRRPEYEATEPALYVSAAALDDPNAFPPTEVVWYSQRPAWFALDTDIPRHAGSSVENEARSLNFARKMRI